MFLNIKLIFIIFIFFVSIINNSFSKEIKIILKVNKDIITNQDIQNEMKYLTALNKSLRNLNEEQLFIVAKDSYLENT